MHIVFVTTELATSENSSGGLASFTANISRIFAQKGHKVTILLSAVKEENLKFDNNITLESAYVKKEIWDKFDKVATCISKFCKEDKDEIRRLFVNYYKSKQVKKKIIEINQKNKIDIIHYCSLGFVALKANKKIPYIIRISSFMNICRGANNSKYELGYMQNPPTIKEKLVNYTLKKSKYIVSPSEMLANIAKEKFNINAEVIESPFVLNRNNWNYDCYNNVARGRKYIIHYGRLSYLKGTHIVAELVREFLNKYPEISIILAGDCENLLDERGKEIKAYELIINNAEQYADRVIYVGKLVREQLYPLLEGAELCLLPSRIENLSNACIEAMAMGKIVVATNGASYEQLIEDRVSGFLCERDNAESFMRGIDEALVLNNDEKEQMIENAVERMKQLSPEIIYEKYLNYYKRVIVEW